MTRALPRSADLASGPVQFGKYTLVRAIGHGGMATVYLAFKTMGTTKKAVALKVSNDFVGLDPKRREGILNEIRIGGRMRHSNIVSVMDAGEYGGVVFIELELIDGHDLRQFVEDLARRDQQLPFAIIAYILRGILEGLNYAHVDFTVDGVSQQVVHRDLTPSNVILSTSGEVKIIDFGIGKYFDEHTSGAYLKGKPRYMAPEHAAGSSSPSIDIFPVGAILYELIEGRRFREDFPSADLYAVAAGGYVPELRRADVPEAFHGLYRALVEADPYRRVHSAAAAMAMLDLWDGRPAQASELRAVVRVHTGGTHSGYTQGEFVIPEGLEAAVAIANAREEAARGGPVAMPAATAARGRPEPTEDAPRGGHPHHGMSPVEPARVEPPVAPDPDAPHSPRWGRVTPAAGRAPANDRDPTAVEPRPIPWPAVEPPPVADGTEVLASPDFVRPEWPGARPEGLGSSEVAQRLEPPRSRAADETVFVVASGRIRPWHLAVGFAFVLVLSAGVGVLLAFGDGDRPRDVDASAPVRLAEGEESQSDADAAAGAATVAAGVAPAASGPKLTPSDSARALEPEPIAVEAGAQGHAVGEVPVAVEPVVAVQPTVAEVPAAPAVAPPSGPTVAPPKPVPPSKAPARKPVPKAPAVKVTVRVIPMLAVGELKIGKQVHAVDKNSYDLTVPVGKHVVRWRARGETAWQERPAIVLSVGRDYLLHVGNKGTTLTPKDKP